MFLETIDETLKECFSFKDRILAHELQCTTVFWKHAITLTSGTDFLLYLRKVKRFSPLNENFLPDLPKMYVHYQVEHKKSHHIIAYTVYYHNSTAGWGIIKIPKSKKSKFEANKNTT